MADFVPADKGELQPLVSKSIDTSSRSATLRVRILTSVVSLAEGYDLSVISGAIIIVTKELRFSNLEVGLIVGCAYFATAVGSFVVGSMMNWMGRKFSLCISYATLGVGSLIMAFGSSFLELLVGRVIIGIGIGMGITAISTYIAEVSPATHRGLFSSAEEMFIVLGILLGYLANYALLGIQHDWRWMLGLGAVIPVLFTLLLLTPLFPESPRYLLQKGRTDEAKAVLASLVSSEEVEKVLLQWKGIQIVDNISWAQVLCPAGKAERRALHAGMLVGSAQMMSGISVLGLFSSMLLEAELGMKQACLQVVLIGVARVIFCGFSTVFLVDNWGRRPLLLLSSSGLTLSSVYLAIAYHSNIAVIPWKLFGLYAFVCFFSVGLGPVTYTYIGEVFNADVRTKAISVAMTLGRVFAGVLLLCFPTLKGAVGVHGVFYFLALVNAGISYSFFVCIRETRHVELESIWKVFSSAPTSARSSVEGSPR